MRKIRTMIGMPVVCGGHRIGRMLQAELSDDLKRLGGIWVGAGIRGTRYIPADRLEILGRAAILADTPGVRRKMRPSPNVRRAISTDGQRLGAITGAEVDEYCFGITALELSFGLWEDLKGQRRRVTRYCVNRETGEVIVHLAEYEMEGIDDEERHGEGADYRRAGGQLGGDALWRPELAHGAQVEPEGAPDHQLDL